MGAGGSVPWNEPTAPPRDNDVSIRWLVRSLLEGKTTLQNGDLLNNNWGWRGKVNDISELGERQKEINIISTLWALAIADIITYFQKAIAGDKGIHDILSSTIRASYQWYKQEIEIFRIKCYQTTFGVESVKISECLFSKNSGIDLWYISQKYHCWKNSGTVEGP